MSLKEIKRVLSPLGLKIRRSSFGYLITRTSDGEEFANFADLSQVEHFLLDFFNED